MLMRLDSLLVLLYFLCCDAEAEMLHHTHFHAHSHSEEAPVGTQRIDDLPFDSPHSFAGAAVVVPQNYSDEKVNDLNRGRKLQTGKDNPAWYSPSMRLQSSQLQSTVGPMRIKFVYDFLDATDPTGQSDDSNGHCHKVGARVDPCKTRRSSCPYVCKEEDVITSAKRALVSTINIWIRDYIKLGVIVNTVTNGIKISDQQGGVLHKFTPPSSMVYDYSEADLIVLVTMQPSPDANVAGFAYCAQTDALNRCTVGVYNFCPAVIDPQHSASPEVLQDLRSTALHETMHLLGCCSPLSSGVFRHDDTTTTDPSQYGKQRDDSDLFFFDSDGDGDPNKSVGGYYKKRTLLLKTPMVVQVAKAQFGCTDLAGVQLEDQPLGKNSHWESRVFGPEVMSYGGGTGEPYLSDMTLAFLEDTRQYVIMRDLASDNPLTVKNEEQEAKAAAAAALGMQTKTSGGNNNSSSVAGGRLLKGSLRKLSDSITDNPDTNTETSLLGVVEKKDDNDNLDDDLDDGNDSPPKDQVGVIGADGKIIETKMPSSPTEWTEAFSADLENSTMNDSDGKKLAAPAYRWGGRLLANMAEEGAASNSWSALITGTQTVIDTTLAFSRSPGHIRWGRNEGCSFLRGSAAKWPKRYACNAKSPTAGGCTPDNRMSARCHLVEYGPGKNSAPKVASCSGSGQPGFIPQEDEWKAEKCEENKNSPYLAPLFSYFSSEDGSKASGIGGILGGFSPSMDHAPVRVGYWSCLDAKPTSTKSRMQSAPDTSKDFSKIFESLSTDLDLFGGQSHCRNCRCFESSLVELGSLKFDPTLPKYGLCYAANCFSPTYLQFKIRGRINSAWYKCPTDGGEVFLPGFSGSITCPPAKEFCKHEVITGVLYGESNLMLEWIIFGGTLFLALTIFFCCCCNSKVRRPCAKRFKIVCGLPTKTGELEKSGSYRRFMHRADQLKLSSKRSCSSKVLALVNFAWMMISIVGFFVVILAANKVIQWKNMEQQLPFFVTCLVFTAVISLMGFMTAKDDKANIKTVCYFYLCIFMIIAIVVVLVLYYFFENLFMKEINNIWEVMKYLYTPEKYHSMTFEEAFAEFQNETIASSILFGITGTTVGSVLIGAFCAGRILGFKALQLNFAMMANFYMLIGSIVLIIHCNHMHKIFSVLTNLPFWPVPLTYVPCTMLLLSSLICVYGSFKVSPRILKGAKYLVLITSLGMIATGVVLLLQVGVVEADVQELSKNEMELLAEALAFSGDHNEFTGWVTAVVKALATLLLIFGGCEFFVFLLTFAAQIILRARRDAMKKYEETKRQYELNGLPPPVPPGFSMMELYFIAFPEQGNNSNLNVEEGEEISQDRLAAMLASNKAGGISYKARYRRTVASREEADEFNRSRRRQMIIEANRGQSITISKRGVRERFKSMQNLGEIPPTPAGPVLADPEKVKEMASMGFPADVCAEALSLLGNNVVKATALIVGQQRAEELRMRNSNNSANVAVAVPMPAEPPPAAPKLPSK